MGASGVGKSAVSYPLARRLGWPLVEVDDIVEALHAMTTPEQQPDLHYWSTHPEEAGQLPVDRIVRLQIRVAQALLPAVRAVVENHLETDTPVVVEGDYLLPLPPTPGVRGVVLHEPDAAQLVTNYLVREPEAGAQTTRAEASLRYGQWLVDQAKSAGVPVVAARPWGTALERVVAALG